MGRQVGLVVLAGLVGFLGLAPIAGAVTTTTYVYEGSDFETFLDVDPPAGKYDTSMQVTGSIMLEAPLSQDMLLTDITSLVLSAMLSDGRQTLSAGDCDQSFEVSVATDATGRITEWDFGCTASSQDPETVRSILTRNTPGMAPVMDSGAILVSPSANPDIGLVADKPGSWTTPVPEPGTLGLLAMGLAGLASTRRRQP